MAYSSSGAMHVLAVSGLHVGIVFMVFSWMFYFLEKIKYGKIGKSILLVLLLWSYALLTGLSPSVLRACTMFSFVIVGKSLNRYVSIYNILAVSAMFLLLINPYIIMEVGFQLSYLAVLGIVYIQPKMQLIWEPKNSWLQRIWTLITVSISAQIATFPLGLHYFHQFPIWFILSNLIVIPLSTAIIYIAILLLCIAKVSFIADLVAVLLKATLFSLNYSVKKIKDLPYSLLEGIHISVLETWIIYGIILLFLFYLFKRKFKFLVYCLLLLVAILTMQVLEQFQELKQKKFIVYNVSKNSALEIIAGKKHFFIGNHTLVNNEKEMRFNIKHNWWKLGLSNTVYLPTNYCSTIICKIKNTISFDKCLIAIVAKDFTFNFSSKIHKLKVDYLIVANNPKLSIEQLLKVYQVKKIIFDSSNSYYHLNKWKIACAKFKQPFYSVADCGAFVVNF
jgi:competence protein ComEC